jgi:tetratricopeptide (TPR) repeat protein
MRKLLRTCLLALAACHFVLSGAAAQDVFKNPAMEPEDESQKAFTHARVLLRQGRPEEAIDEFRRAAKLRNDQCADCFSFIGQINLQMQKFKEAAAAFRQAAGLKSPKQAEFYNALGVALYLQDDKQVLDEAIAALRRSIELSGGKVVKAYYNLGYTLIKAGKTDDGIAALKSYLEADPDANDAAQVQAIIANPKIAGEHLAIPFKVTSSAGDELSLEKFKGKVVLLDFWASWCGPCRAEMPAMKEMWKKYKGDQFIIIGISQDTDRNAFENYVKQEELTWPQYYDGPGSRIPISQLYNVRAIPHTVLIDQEGVIRAVGLRGRSLANKIGDLLKSSAK